MLDLVPLPSLRHRVLFFGDRNWLEALPIIERLRREKDMHGPKLVVISGMARGADSLAAFHARAMNITVEEYRADWERYGLGAGPIRNQQMLNTGLGYGYGFHENLATSKGTWDMCTRLLNAQVSFEIYPEGQWRHRA